MIANIERYRDETGREVYRVGEQWGLSRSRAYHAAIKRDGYGRLANPKPNSGFDGLISKRFGGDVWRARAYVADLGRASFFLKTRRGFSLSLMAKYPEIGLVKVEQDGSLSLELGR